MVLYISKGHLWASIPEGLYVLTSNWGVLDKEPAKAGFMLLPPWKKIVCVIPKHHIPVDVPIKLCPTLDNVMIQVDVVIVLHVQNPYDFYVNIGPHKLQHIVSSFVEETIRSVARTIPYYEAYDLRNMDSEGDMTRSLNEKMEHFGVACTDITITDIFIPSDLRNSMAETTGYQSSTRAHNREHKFLETKLEHEEFRLFEDLKHQNQRFAYETETDKLVSMIKKETDEIGALATKSVSEILSKQYGEVLEITSKAQLESAKLDGEKIKFLDVTLAKGLKDSTIIKYEQLKYTNVVKSQMIFNVAENKAKALLLISDAEDKSKSKLKYKREDTVKRAQIAIITALSENGNVQISGSSTDDKIAQIMGTNILIEDVSQPKISKPTKPDETPTFKQQRTLVESLKNEIFKPKEEIIKEEIIEIDSTPKEDLDNYINPTQFTWFCSPDHFQLKQNSTVCMKTAERGWNYVIYSSSTYKGTGKYFCEIRIRSLNQQKLIAVGLATKRNRGGVVQPSENQVVSLTGFQHNLEDQDKRTGGPNSNIGIFADFDAGICRFFIDGMLLKCYAILGKRKYSICVHLFDKNDEVFCYFPEKIPKKILELTSK